MGRWYEAMKRDAKRRNPKPRTNLFARLQVLEVMQYEANSYLVSALASQAAREGGEDRDTETDPETIEANRQRAKEFLQAAEEFRRHLSQVEGSK